jgi:hypothetical protein
MNLDLQLDLYKIDKQSELDIGTIESNSYQNLLRSAQEWGTGSMLSLQDFIFTSANSFAGILTSMAFFGHSTSGWWFLPSWPRCSVLFLQKIFDGSISDQMVLHRGPSDYQQ